MFANYSCRTKFLFTWFHTITDGQTHRIKPLSQSRCLERRLNNVAYRRVHDLRHLRTRLLGVRDVISISGRFIQPHQRSCNRVYVCLFVFLLDVFCKAASNVGPYGLFWQPALVRCSSMLGLYLCLLIGRIKMLDYRTSVMKSYNNNNKSTK